MTKFAIISDIHANIDALELVLKDAERRGADQIICLGDLVAKYYYPAEVVDSLVDANATILKGNCDAHVVENENFRFARGKLGLDRINLLDSLPIKKQMLIGKVLVNLFHATPDNIENMFNPNFNNSDYPGGAVTDYKKMFIGDGPQVSIYGHTHEDFIGRDTGKDFVVNDKKEIVLTDKDRIIINTGAVGEHNTMTFTDDGERVKRIDSYVTYVLLDDTVLQNGNVKAQVINIPYKDTLKKIYISSLAKQKNHEIPSSPKDTLERYNALIQMGVDPKELEGPKL